MPTYIVLLGPPGAGKGTQAEVLAAKTGLLHVSSGDLFRENMKQNTPLGALAKGYIAKGELVPNDVTIGMILERLSQPDCEAGAILDGFPRTPEQADALEKMLAELGGKVNQVLYITAPTEVLAERTAGRWTCRAHGHIYHEKNSVNTTEISKTMEYNLPEDIEMDETTVNTTNIVNSEIQKLETMGNRDNYNYMPLIIGAVFATPIVLAFALLTYLVKQILSMGYVHLTLDATRNKKLDYRTILSEVNIKKALKLMVASALYGLYIILGLILFIIPGIYIALKYFFVYYLIIDKDLSIKEAFKQSSEMTKGVKLKLMGLSIATVIVTFLGLLVFIIGVIPASIICTLAIAYTYEELSNTVKVKK